MAILAGGWERAIEDKGAVSISLRFVAQIASDLLMGAVQRPLGVAVVIKDKRFPCIRGVTTAALDFYVRSIVKNKLITVRILVAKFAFPRQRGHTNHLFRRAQILAGMTGHAFRLIMLSDKRETGR